MSERLRFTTAQAGEYGGCHEQTVRKACEAGELHGGQRKPGGRWSIRRACLDAWLDGSKCEHQIDTPAPATSPSDLQGSSRGGAA